MNNEIKDEYVAALEVLFYLEANPIRFEDIKRKISLSDDEIKITLETLEINLQKSNRGFYLRNLDGFYSVVPKSELIEYLPYYIKDEKSISKNLLQVLAIIAYKQPISRPEIELMKGTDSTHAIKNLLQRGLIVEVGKDEVFHRRILYGTTLKFLEVFNLNSINDLPVLDELEKEKFELN